MRGWDRLVDLDSLRYPFSVTSYFIPEFIARMRRMREVAEKPSPRQSIAMCNLLLSAYLRKGYLSFHDLAEIAVRTTRVENQRPAERVACEILLDLGEEKPPPSEDETFSGLLSPKSDDLISYLPTEAESEGMAELQARHDSDVDILKGLTDRPDLGVGPGEDELLKACIRRAKAQGDERSKRILVEFLKAGLLKLGRRFERNLDFRRIPMLRPFEPGDDPDLIDEERSMENILDLGRAVDEVRCGDFLIRRRNRRRRSIIYILDISNTMFYETDGVDSIQHSVMSLVPLLWALRRDRYGLVLYESNSHVQKGLYDGGDEEDLIDSLLALATSTTSGVERVFGRTRGSMGRDGPQQEPQVGPRTAGRGRRRGREAVLLLQRLRAGRARRNHAGQDRELHAH